MTARIIRPNSTVLDIGCGDGRLSIELAKRTKQQDCKVIGVDYQDEAIIHSNKKKEIEGLSNIQFIKVDYENPFPRDIEAFDAIVSYDVIEHIAPSDISAFITGVIDKLKPGGIAIFSTPNRQSLRNRVRGFHLNTKKHFCEYTYHEIKSLFASHQIKINWIKGLYIPIPLRFIKLEEFKIFWYNYFKGSL